MKESQACSYEETEPSVRGTAVKTDSSFQGVMNSSLKSVGPRFQTDVGGPSLSVSLLSLGRRMEVRGRTKGLVRGMGRRRRVQDFPGLSALEPPPHSRHRAWTP